jgi:hypothetical protein
MPPVLLRLQGVVLKLPHILLLLPHPSIAPKRQQMNVHVEPYGFDVLDGLRMRSRIVVTSIYRGNWPKSLRAWSSTRFYRQFDPNSIWLKDL